MAVRTVHTLNRYDYIGLSTDEKPIDRVTDGAYFIESDTRTMYRFLDGVWYPVDDGIPYVWNPNTLQKDRLVQPVVNTDTVDVDLTDTNAILQDIEENTAPKTIRMAENGGYTYIGKAAPGSLETASVWQVFRIDADGTLLFAGGTAGFTNRWDQHLTATYS